MTSSLFSSGSDGLSSTGKGMEISSSENRDDNSAIPWKSEARQRIYSSKLFHALRHLRVSGGVSGEKALPPKRVRDAAYRLLATAAKGRSRWSRAILSSRLQMKFAKRNSVVKRYHRLMNSAITTGNSRLQWKSKSTLSRLKTNDLPAFQRKARVLSKLIPGCRKQPLLVVLEEVIDYIPALEMQIRAMSELAQRLSSNGSTTASDDAGSSGVSPS